MYICWPWPNGKPNSCSSSICWNRKIFVPLTHFQPSNLLPLLRVEEGPRFFFIFNFLTALGADQGTYVEVGELFPSIWAIDCYKVLCRVFSGDKDDWLRAAWVIFQKAAAVVYIRNLGDGEEFQGIDYSRTVPLGARRTRPVLSPLMTPALRCWFYDQPFFDHDGFGSFGYLNLIRG